MRMSFAAATQWRGATVAMHARVAAWFLLSVLVASCGGGGDESSVPPGAFTLTGNSASFTVFERGAAPAAKTFQMSITGRDVTYAGAAYTNGQTQPQWLGIDLTGAGTNYTLAVSIRSTFLAPGQYSSTFSVGTADAGGNILQRQDVTVTLTVDQALAVTSPASSPISLAFQFGDTRRTEVLPVAVRAPNRTWSVTSTAPWLQVPSGNQTGTQTIGATIDVTNLAPGNYSATVRVANTDNSQDSALVQVLVSIAPPVLSVPTTGLVFGGSDGRAALSAQPLSFSLSTGQGIHPYTLSATTQSGGNWLNLERASGTVGAAGAAVQVAVNRGQLRGGSYTGLVTLTATVNGTVLTETRPVRLNLEASRLVVSAAGVGFSRVPGRDVLTRSIKVVSNLGRTDVPWVAESSAPWLAISASGNTGGALVLTANPGGLANDTTHYATVTVTSPDTTVENQASIRVGLYVTDQAPGNASVALRPAYLATSPVDPVVAVSNRGTDVWLYNVYSGALVRILANVAARAGSLAYASNGSVLYVHDVSNFRVVAVDPTTGATLATYDATASPALGFGVGSAVGFFSPDGYPMLITPAARIYDVQTGREFSSTDFLMPTSTLSYSFSDDQSLVVSTGGSSTRVRRSVLEGGRMTAQPDVFVSTAQGRAGQACISAANDRIYTASGAPYEFPATSVATGQVIQILPGTNYPNSIVCAWNGIVVGGVDGYYAENDIFVYYGPTGVSLAQRSSNLQPGAYRNLVERGLAISADGTRLISAVDSFSSAQYGLFFQGLPSPLQ
jgi:hypothetical protein